jgi:hypothetical protein
MQNLAGVPVKSIRYILEDSESYFQMRDYLCMLISCYLLCYIIVYAIDTDFGEQVKNMRRIIA